mgnify:CR=1 FL=1
MELYRFKRAQAIWARGREEEMNCELAFRAVIPAGDVELHLAASSVYRLWINGEFVSAGPARAAHGYYNVDEIRLGRRLTQQENVAVIEVVGYNVNSYDTLDQPAFLTAEFLREGDVIACTAGEGIQVHELKQRVRKIQRYSLQRAFGECYRLRAENRKFYTQAAWEALPASLPFAVQPGKRYLGRSVPMPKFERLAVKALAETGMVDFGPMSSGPVFFWERERVGKTLKGFLPQELEERLSDEGQSMTFRPAESAGAGMLSQAAPEEPFPLQLEDGYGLYELPFNATGFIRLEVQCGEPCTVYLMFDEILAEGKLDFRRMSTYNFFKYTLDPGRHSIMTFAPYTMKYIRAAVKGKALLQGLELVEYKHPPVGREVNLPEDSDLREIYCAARESYLSNAVDIFMDCPSRERAGWLCDSFFTSRVEHVLTGECLVERAFLNNFILAEKFDYLPEGMLPMCYPADHNDCAFIPNWAMWFVLELEEYLARSGDRELVDRAKPRVMGLVDYFAAFENEFGLLEKLDSWVFVEWSRANDPDVVQDVNFPTNMLYKRMLEAVASLYGEERLRKKAARIRQVIRERSFNGTFYTDNERRTESGLENPGNCTEVCQYYAFFTGTATKEEDAALWETLLRDFGFGRKELGLHPRVAFANAFIGNYLRIELLYREGLYEEVLNNIRGYFAKMAALTGTLWEHDMPSASCNHGFASHVIYWLAGIYGIRESSD